MIELYLIERLDLLISRMNCFNITDIRCRENIIHNVIFKKYE